jgi:hypothetical protein
MEGIGAASQKQVESSDRTSLPVQARNAAEADHWARTLPPFYSKGLALIAGGHAWSAWFPFDGEPLNKLVHAFWIWHGAYCPEYVR